MTTARELVDQATLALQAAGVPSPRHDAEGLLAFVLGLDRSSLDPAVVLSSHDVSRYDALVSRRVGREPLQHLTGTTGFRYLDLEVGPGVFTPRPETEVMTGVVIDELRRLASLGIGPLRAVDLCAGSGAIGLAIATEMPEVMVTAVEVSPDACVYARRNADSVLGADRNRYDLREGDIADRVEDLADQVHVVVANPPYIPLAAFESVAPEARDFDPPVALWSGDDGLDAIAVVAEVGARLLVDDGLIVCEHADVQGESALAVFSVQGTWSRVRDNKDLADRPRYVSARRVPRAAAAAGTMVL